jgi:hypothetical protein
VRFAETVVVVWIEDYCSLKVRESTAGAISVTVTSHFSLLTSLITHGQSELKVPNIQIHGRIYEHITFNSLKITVKVKLSCYMPWRHMGGEEV